MSKKNESVSKQTKKELEKAPDSPIFPTPEVHVLADTNELHLFKCPNCQNVHFRHAGYLEVQMPYIDTQGPNPKVSVDSKSVKVCVSCKHSYITHDSKIWDVSKHIDLNAWEKTEKEAHKATGPGGDC